MTSTNVLRAALLGSLLTISALSSMALTNNAHANTLAKDEYNFDAKPFCNFGMEKSVLRANGAKPTGLVASKNGWDLEIYQNPEKKSWVLLGKRNAEGASKKLCLLDNGVSDYTKTKWYQPFFDNQTSPQ